MITKEQALSRPSEIWHVSQKNANGTPYRVRSSGACKVWKTRPSEFVLPVKNGIYNNGYVSNLNAAEWCLPSHWEIERHYKVAV